jgi:hypothetical protein
MKVGNMNSEHRPWGSNSSVRLFDDDDDDDDDFK